MIWAEAIEPGVKRERQETTKEPALFIDDFDLGVVS
jgi:hypothetical protein